MDSSGTFGLSSEAYVLRAGKLNEIAGDGLFDLDDGDGIQEKTC